MLRYKNPNISPLGRLRQLHKTRDGLIAGLRLNLDVVPRSLRARPGAPGSVPVRVIAQAPRDARLVNCACDCIEYSCLSRNFRSAKRGANKVERNHSPFANPSGRSSKISKRSYVGKCAERQEELENLSNFPRAKNREASSGYSTSFVASECNWVGRGG